MRSVIIILMISLPAACKTVPSSTSATDAALSCVDPGLVTKISTCIDSGTQSPRQCLAQASRAPLCDQDRDGLDDNFESALARSYAMAFAFNERDTPETCWPGQVDHFVKSSLLLYSPGGVSGLAPAFISGRKVLNENPTLGSLHNVQYSFKGVTYNSSNPHQHQGPNFWLCQKKNFDSKKYGGPLGPQEKVSTADLAAALPGGIEAYSIVHATRSGYQADPSQDGSARFIFVATILFYPDNRFTLDDHEGDWEGGGVIVDTEDPKGAVVAGFFDRHPATDKKQLILQTEFPAQDPATDTAGVYQCGDVPTDRGGLRFWDYAGARHHVVIYPGAGGHAGYSYPGSTRVVGADCSQSLPAVNDIHNGDGFKFLPWLGVFAKNWTDETGLPVRDGVRFVNLGEENNPLVSWASYRGQWGCQDGIAGKVGASWPGPFGNQRHCRAWLRHNWNAAPPFSEPNPTQDCQGL